MKKSLLITTYFPPLTGGISKSLYNFCRQFPTDKIVVLTDKKIDKKTAFKVIKKNIYLNYSFVWPKWLPLIFHTYNIIKREKIGLIQVGQIIPIGYIALLYKWLLKIPYIVYIYGQDLIITRDSNRKSALIKKVLEQSNGIIANSNYTKELAISLGISKKIEVVYPCPQASNFFINLDKLSIFKKENNLENKKVLLTVGNLVKRKGHDNVIRVLKNIIEQNISIIYIIIGNGPELNNLRKLTNELKLNNHVQFKINVDDEQLKFYYAACDIFIMTSSLILNKNKQPIDVEGFGMVFLEANFYGKPVIGGNNGGQIDAIEHNKSGLLVDATKIEEISSAINKLIQNDKLAMQIGEYGRSRVLHEFNWRNQTNKIISLINTLD